ncbi:hypothetical protein ACSAM1_13125 [Xanthomonas citri pv. bilvae]
MKADPDNVHAPHSLWHYLDDVDIRMKDGRYAADQIAGIKEELRMWPVI